MKDFASFFAQMFHASCLSEPAASNPQACRFDMSNLAGFSFLLLLLFITTNT